MDKEISIHALREEGDLGGVVGMSIVVVFLSTPSARRATEIGHGTPLDILISIHALREEGDNSPCVAWEQGHSISIHALREEGDPSCPQ